MGIQVFDLTDDGCLPAGTDIDTVLAEGSEPALYAIWNTYYRNKLRRDIVDRIDRGETPGPPAELEARRRAALDGFFDCPQVTTLEALAANRRLVELLTTGRTDVMRDARESGTSWTAIGNALGMTKQGALDWFKRKVAEQERLAPLSHDADRARAVLDGGDE